MFFVMVGILAVMVIVSRFICGTWRWGYILGGVMYGLYNEVFFAAMWTYSPKLAPMLWSRGPLADVPIGVILGWGVQSVFALSIVDRIGMKWKQISGGWARFGMDILIFAVINVPNEIMWSNLGLWTYNDPWQENRIVQVFGYIFTAIVLLSVARRVQRIVDRN